MSRSEIIKRVQELRNLWENREEQSGYVFIDPSIFVD